MTDLEKPPTTTALYSWAMFPVYAWQGIRLRMRIERLLPAPVPTQGAFPGNSPEVRLLVMGDSTVASVGMETLEDTLAFNIAKAVNDETGWPVSWRAAGGNSATASDLRDFIVPHVEPRDWTHIALSVGINDMKNFHMVRRFKRDFGALLYSARARFPQARIVWCPIPDMRQCPALPPTLGRILAARAELINAMGARMCRERGAIVTDPVPPQSVDAFARDGFHPNGDGYRVWGRHFARWIVPPRGEADPLPDEVTPLRRTG
ncbi:MAG: SGNH/GDSL hydrolase family protein [Roseitalea sp.]|jgi:lysophospholipase L1-like esterase|uniref:SGNH/GDSL hydrolase family protein n=1 Tax=Oceaniradius stylonematis TaxID=2184161 RepID=A0A3A8AJL7_9HYPH|nr:SGNH/GDSL hydrolase family protein [Oceaniradius stylonematis]MBO6551793.1 SGNH/GDSL hydrolase family protein [Roseitalea sp.]MBO6951827.1 SGNH/GDSL hydrolase family protein [Rhizobiaceae bacterium]RNC95742.1 MAG: SGNH/GDSL hydrolase family protein [Oricola sp.]MBO6592327.1 SGNH/GDSL hydrolase family protein [Roseitalea sp.]MBO6598582.1 SGNH/GDSL hydrolase family protein [Roseitalea sp.]